MCLQQGLGALQAGERGQQLVPLSLQAPHLLAVLVLLDEALGVLQLDPVTALDGLGRAGGESEGAALAHGEGGGRWGTRPAANIQ